MQDTVKRMQRQVTEWEKIFEKSHLIIDMYQEYIKNS